MSQTSTIFNQEQIPSEGALFLPNRLDFHEILQLEQLLEGRSISWLCEINCATELDPLITNHLDRDNISAISFDQNNESSKASTQSEIAALIKQGHIVIYLTGSANTCPGSLFHIPGETLAFLTSLKLPTTPLCINYPLETSLALDPEELPTSFLSFGSTIPSNQISTAAWQESIFSLNEICFSKRKLLNLSLPYVLLGGLKKFGKSRSLHDGADDSELTYDKLLGAAIAFSKEIKQQTQKSRVAIILPPGKAGMIANLAVLFAGKIPVNLNFSASHQAIKSAIKQSDVDKYITADPFVRKVSSFPWPPNRDLIYVERTLPRIKKQIVRWVVASKSLPLSALAKLLGIPKHGGDKEAVLLFTSGSSGEPKGVPLTHKNIIANVCQFGSRIHLSNNAHILGCLPLFHSFGSTVTLWFPIIEGINLVTFPSPLDTKRLGELIEKHEVELLLSTPTFLRGFMRRVTAEQMRSLKLCITGAEKLPASVANAFNEKFGVLPQEGYGLTETSPASNVNMPNFDTGKKGVKINSNRFGSVGQFLQGVAVKITTIDNDAPLPIDQPGIIWVKGANVFRGYLNNEQKTNEVIKDGWFKTGDVGKIDSDGFLYIEGRISRFSKIGGEMVPHEGVEDAINKGLGLAEETERKFAIVGIPDRQKGEAIAMLSTLHQDTLEQECLALRYTLMDAGVPSLWCPKQILPVDEIPVLASGKLDIKECQNLVESLLA